MRCEGTEKKIALTVGADGPDLRALGPAFWQQVVRASGSTVIGVCEDRVLDAWLLSEASLLVGSHRALMITPGEATAVEAWLHVLQAVGPEHVATLTYECRNTDLAAGQPPPFGADVARLRRHLPGVEQIFGRTDGDHVSLFHLDRPATILSGDTTLELLMHGIASPVVERLLAGGDDTGTVRSRLGLDDLLDGFTCDDHVGEPRGYALNAVAGRRYATLHVRPRPQGMSASFELGWDFSPEQASACLERLLGVFAPARADLLYFTAPVRLGFLPEGFTPQRITDAVLGNGYHVVYCHLERAPGSSG
jgi:hypothetical protein